MRFELIDRITERRPDGLTAVKCVTNAEEYLADHFPRFAVLPGVMMLEALVQAARAYLAEAAPGNEPWVLAEVRNIRYGNMVRPGQSLVVQITSRGKTDAGWEFQGVGLVGAEQAVQGRFRLVPLK